MVWFDTGVGSHVLLRAVFCFHCLRTCSFCWFLGVPGPVLSSLRDTAVMVVELYRFAPTPPRLEMTIHSVLGAQRDT